MHTYRCYSQNSVFLTCFQKSIAKSLSRKYSASNGLAAKGLHLSHPHRELLSIGWLHMPEMMIVEMIHS